MRRFMTVALLMTLGGSPAFANDSSAAMAVGGLELVKNKQVRMVSEILRIAPRLIEVDYVFENTSGTDITTEVAFPLPDLHQAVVYNSPLNIPYPNLQNFVGFQVWIDGKEIRPKVEVRAFAKGEITAELKRFNIDPVSPGEISSEAIETLLPLDAVVNDGSTTYEAWTAKVNLHWSQVFPAGKQIAVRHRYRPTYGNFYVHHNPESPHTKNEQKLGGQWCFDQSFKAGELRLFIRQREAAIKNKNHDSSDLSINYENIQYVLKTGANWQGPIGRFELQIDKGGANLISTCPIPGLRLQPTTYGFNAVATDYTPVSDLDILFVSDRWLGKPDSTAEKPR